MLHSGQMSFACAQKEGVAGTMVLLGSVEIVLPSAQLIQANSAGNGGRHYFE
jgi:hypothetical protein